MVEGAEPNIAVGNQWPCIFLCSPNSPKKWINMLPCDIFSLAVASSSSLCFQSKELSEKLQGAIFGCLEGRRKGTATSENNLASSTLQKLSGWSLILDDFLHQNYLTDVQTFNYPREPMESTKMVT